MGYIIDARLRFSSDETVLIKYNLALGQCRYEETKPIQEQNWVLMEQWGDTIEDTMREIVRRDLNPIIIEDGRLMLPHMLEDEECLMHFVD